MSSKVPPIILNNGVEMPQLGRERKTDDSQHDAKAIGSDETQEDKSDADDTGSKPDYPAEPAAAPKKPTTPVTN